MWVEWGWNNGQVRTQYSLVETIQANNTRGWNELTVNHRKLPRIVYNEWQHFHRLTDFFSDTNCTSLLQTVLLTIGDAALVKTNPFFSATLYDIVFCHSILYKLFWQFFFLHFPLLTTPRSFPLSQPFRLMS